MSKMGKAVTEKVADIEVICRELNVSQVRALVSKEPGPDMVSGFLLADIALDDLSAFTNLTESQIEEMLPSDLELVQDLCKRANPTFFGMLDRLNKIRKPV